MKYDCRSIEEALALFVYEELSPGEMGRAGIHIGGCESCRTSYEETRAVLDLADRYQVEHAPVDVEAVVSRGAEPGRSAIPLRRLGLALAAAVALAALVPVALLLASRERPGEPPVVASVEPDEPGVEPTPEVPAPVEAPLVEKRIDLAAARTILEIASVGGPALEAREVRRRLHETGVDVDLFLLASVREAPAPVARTALGLLEATSPGRAIEAAELGLRVRADFVDPAIGLLSRTPDARATSVLGAAWKEGGEGRVAAALASRGTPAAARALAERLASIPGSAEVWDALVSMGPLAAEPLARVVDRLPPERASASVEVVGRARSSTTLSALRSLLARSESKAGAAVVLARWGDPAALETLLGLAESSDSAARALGAFASRNPALLLQLVAREEDLGSPRFAAAVRALASGRPDRLAAMVGDLARQASARERAIAVARAARSASAALALLPLGRDRRLAPLAVEAAQELGKEGSGVLVAFLSTRYGAEPARAALASLQ